MTKLSDAQWAKIYAYLTTRSDIYVKNEAKTRLFVEAVLWIVRTGAQWRAVPEKLGKWNSVFKRFDRWAERGIWDAMFHHFGDDPDLKYLLIDSTIIRAHP